MIRLSDSGVERYSPAEQKLFQLLPKNGSSISSTKLMERFYNGKRMPVHGRQIIYVALRRLMLKVEQNREPFRIGHSEREVRTPIKWYVDQGPAIRRKQMTKKILAQVEEIKKLIETEKGNVPPKIAAKFDEMTAAGEEILKALNADLDDEPTQH